jgi:hypothetical protein
MKVRLAWVAALGVLLVCAAPARAEEKIKVSIRTRYKAGEIVTVTEQETENQVVKVMVGGKPVNDETKTTETSVVYVLKCLEADASGHMTKGIVHFSEFTIAVGAEKDETLKGRTYRLAGMGKARKITPFGDPTKSESEAAMAWLSKSLGAESHDDEMGDLVSSDAPVGAGDSVSVSMKGFASLIPIPLDVEKSSGKTTFEAVAPDEVTAVTEFTLATKGLPGQDGVVMAWAEGGQMSFKRRSVDKPDGSAAPSEVTEEGDWSGTTTEQAQGFSVVFKVTQRKSTKAIVGGELPAGIEKPEEKPGGDAPAPDKPAPDKPVEPEKPGEPAPDQPK